MDVRENNLDLLSTALRQADPECASIAEAIFRSYQGDAFVQWSIYQQALFRCWYHNRADLAARGLQICSGATVAVNISSDDREIWDVGIRWFAKKSFISLTLSAALKESPAAGILLVYLSRMMPLFARYGLDVSVDRSWTLCNWDAGIIDGALSYCSSNPKAVLIPDPEFVHTKGYAHVRSTVASSDVIWDDREAIAFWRGSPTGQHGGSFDWEALPRLKLCRISQSLPGMIDAKLCQRVHDMSEQQYERFVAEDITSDFVGFQQSMNFKYLIDVDGYTNAWSGLFTKLLSGSVVLKVESSSKFRQWYYDRLEAWVNYVPVASDLSDLSRKIEWLMAHDDEARHIAMQSRRLAQSMSYESELGLAVSRMNAE